MGHLKGHLIEEDQSDICLLTALLPPPVSLDLLCAITNQPPVMVLQVVEDLVKNHHLSRYLEKGVGYYYLTDFKEAHEKLHSAPYSRLSGIAMQAIAGVCEYLPDDAHRWLNLANIYQVSRLPLAHFQEVIKAGHHCLTLNLPMDAAQYYRLALEGIEHSELEREHRQFFIDATIALCTCRDTSLPKDIQRRYLDQALIFSVELDDHVNRVKLEVLLAKTFMRTRQSAEAARHLDIASQLLSQQEVPPEIQIQVATANSDLDFWSGYITKAIECYESAIGSHEELSSDVETLKSCIRLGWAYGVAGETARGVGLIRAVLKKAKELSAPDLERYATLVLVIVLAEAGRIEEGEVFLNQLFDTPIDLLDHYTLWPGNGKRAYFAYCRGDYEQAFLYQGMAWQNSKFLGSPHHRGPDNLEVMLGLEAMGMVHPEWNFEYDVKRLLEWPDIYMQGVAYRFRAQKEFQAKAPIQQVKADLKKSLRLLHQAGAKIELAHAQVLMARVCISEENVTNAKRLLKQSWEVFAKVNPGLFPEDLKPFLDRTSKNALWVESLLEVGNALGSVRNREELLGKIIRQAMRIAGAERGAIFFRQHQELKMVASRNLDCLEISGTTFADQIQLIESVFATGQEIVKKADVGRLSQESSLDAKGWTGCFPIRLQARLLGVIFMDRGPTQLQLPEDEIAILRIISNQAAVALDNMQAFEEIIDLNNELEAEAYSYRETFETNIVESRMIGRSDPFKKMLTLISQVANSDTTVMITGETGVGKDLVAQAIHQHSGRCAHPLIAVNLVSLSPELIASELFGHEKGAFTGANQTRKGRFELASQGTLFLDDIDAFTLDIQAKMLRVLESKEFERVGGTRTLKTQFRLLASSNRDLEELVDQGLFRSDFYFRLNVFPIRVPALRERVDDIPVLARYFLDLFAKKFGKQFAPICKRDLETLMGYHWPGNIRELRHVMERSVLLSSSKRLVIPSLDGSPAHHGCSEDKILPFREMEAQHILRALQRCHGKVAGKDGAAALLELRPTTLYSKMKRLGIHRDAHLYENGK